MISPFYCKILNTGLRVLDILPTSYLCKALLLREIIWSLLICRAIEIRFLAPSHLPGKVIMNHIEHF